MSAACTNELLTKDGLLTAAPVDAGGIAGDAGGLAADWRDPALVGARALELARALYTRIRERPLTSLAVAVGVGFLVGGALSFRAGRLALVAAARRVAQEVLKQVL
jgi:hypothetical protein